MRRLNLIARIQNIFVGSFDGAAVRVDFSAAFFVLGERFLLLVTLSSWPRRWFHEVLLARRQRFQFGKVYVQRLSGIVQNGEVLVIPLRLIKIDVHLFSLTLLEPRSLLFSQLLQLIDDFWSFIEMHSGARLERQAYGLVIVRRILCR